MWILVYLLVLTRRYDTRKTIANVNQAILPICFASCDFDSVYTVSDHFTFLVQKQLRAVSFTLYRITLRSWYKSSSEQFHLHCTGSKCVRFTFAFTRYWRIYWLVKPNKFTISSIACM